MHHVATRNVRLLANSLPSAQRYAASDALAFGTRNARSHHLSRVQRCHAKVPCKGASTPHVSCHIVFKGQSPESPQILAKLQECSPCRVTTETAPVYNIAPCRARKENRAYLRQGDSVLGSIVPDKFANPGACATTKEHWLEKSSRANLSQTVFFFVLFSYSAVSSLFRKCLLVAGLPHLRCPFLHMLSTQSTGD